MIFCVCVVQFPLTSAYAVFGVVSGLDMFRFQCLSGF